MLPVFLKANINTAPSLCVESRIIRLVLSVFKYAKLCFMVLY